MQQEHFMSRHPQDTSVREFLVCHGILEAAAFEPPQTRRELYPDIAAMTINTPAALLSAMSRCLPLAWAAQEIYADIRDGLAREHRQESARERPDLSRIFSLSTRIDSLRDEPEHGTVPWLLGLCDWEFRQLVLPEIQLWLASEPHWDDEIDHVPHTMTARGSATEFFSTMAPEQREALGVELLEILPGEGRVTAELQCETAAANELAAELALPVRFRLLAQS